MRRPEACCAAVPVTGPTPGCAPAGRRAAGGGGARPAEAPAELAGALRGAADDRGRNCRLRAGAACARLSRGQRLCAAVVCQARRPRPCRFVGCNLATRAYSRLRACIKLPMRWFQGSLRQGSFVGLERSTHVPRVYCLRWRRPAPPVIARPSTARPTAACQPHVLARTHTAVRAQWPTLYPPARRPHVLIAVVAEASAWLLCAGVLSRHLSERPCRPIPAGMPLLWLLQARAGRCARRVPSSRTNLTIEGLSAHRVLRIQCNAGLGSSACASRHGSGSM